MSFVTVRSKQDDGTRTSRTGEEYIRDEWPEEVLRALDEGGYSPFNPFNVERVGLRWKDCARGLDWKEEKLLDAYSDAAPYTRDIIAHFSVPAFIHDHLTERESLSEEYAKAYNEIIDQTNLRDLLDSGRPIRLRALPGIETLRAAIAVELNRKAARAARETNKLKALFLVPFAEAHHFADGDDRRQYDLWRTSDTLWGRIRRGASAQHLMKLYTAEKGRCPDHLSPLWDVQWDLIEARLQERQPELDAAAALWVRLYATKRLLRDAAYGRPLKPWDEGPTLTPILRIAEALYRPRSRPGRLGWRLEFDRLESKAESPTTLAKWLAGELNLTAGAVARTIRGSGLYEGPGSGASVEAKKAAVQDLIEKLEEMYSTFAQQEEWL